MISVAFSSVEVRLLPDSTLRYDILRSMITIHLNAEYETLLTLSEVNDWREVASLSREVERVWVGECCAYFRVASLCTRKDC